MKIRYTLGIETSCDETAAAIYHYQDGIISNELYSQIATHQQCGGVVPEVASREQLEKIDTIVTTTIQKAGITLADIDVIAVTNKPGLAGSLLVGLCFAKSLAWALGKPLIGINHLEGHTFSALIEQDVPFPHLCLTASGGHTSLHLVHDFGMYEPIAQTEDDAAGEAMDKIAKLMNLPYPGGPILEKLAAVVGFKDFYHYPRSKTPTLDFSFSGLKTAVLYDLVSKGAYNMAKKQFLCDENIRLKQEVASSLHVCIADIFEQKITLTLKKYPQVKALTFVGGVACNQYITSRLRAYAQEHSLSFFSPSRQYCTDNGAMIAFVGNYKAQKNEFREIYAYAK
jgi:N6-L-threonylcarbamoyladenine synthase